MDIIQKDLDNVAREWNNHIVRPSRHAEAPAGFPDILYFPLEGNSLHVYQEVYT